MTNNFSNDFFGTGFQELLTQLFGPLAASSPIGFAPKVTEKESHLEFSFPLPGVSRDNIEVLAKQRSLIVSVTGGENNKSNVVYKVPVTENLDAENAVADTKDGVLTVQIPFAKNRNGVVVKFGELTKDTDAEAKDKTTKEESFE